LAAQPLLLGANKKIADFIVQKSVSDFCTRESAGQSTPLPKMNHITATNKGYPEHSREYPF
jgi:hypothetical protein